MTMLKNGCSCSKMNVEPANWKTGGLSLLKKKWRIYYYFRDPRYKHIEKYKYGLLVRIRGMNKFKTLAERREMTQHLMDQELRMLIEEDYNPIENEKNKPLSPLLWDLEIHPSKNWLEAIQYASGKLKVVSATKLVIKAILKTVKEAAGQLKIDHLVIKDIRLKHIRVLLDHIQDSRGIENWGPASYNSHRAYLHSFFRELLLLEAIDFNPISALPRQTEIRKKRAELTIEEQKAINNYLKPNFYEFWRYINIFFYSGARNTELLTVQAKNVNLKGQTFNAWVKKGRQKSPRLVTYTIMNEALPLWKELIKTAQPDDYVFSVGLLPGTKAIRPDQIKRRWHTHVQVKLGIQKEMYPLKHQLLDKISEKVGMEAAAGHAGHTSTAMVKKIYAQNEEERNREKVKKLKIKFGCS